MSTLTHEGELVANLTSRLPSAEEVDAGVRSVVDHDTMLDMLCMDRCAATYHGVANALVTYLRLSSAGYQKALIFRANLAVVDKEGTFDVLPEFSKILSDQLIDAKYEPMVAVYDGDKFVGLRTVTLRTLRWREWRASWMTT